MTSQPQIKPAPVLGLLPDNLLDWVDKESLLTYVSGIACELMLFRKRDDERDHENSFQVQTLLAVLTFFSSVGLQSFSAMQRTLSTDPALKKFGVSKPFSTRDLKIGMMKNLHSVQACLAELYRQLWYINEFDPNYGMTLHWDGAECDFQDWFSPEELPFQEIARKRLRVLYLSGNNAV